MVCHNHTTSPIWPCVVISPSSLASVPSTSLCPDMSGTLFDKPVIFHFLFDLFIQPLFQNIFHRVSEPDIWDWKGSPRETNEPADLPIMNHYEKTTAGKENSEFPSGWSDITRMFNLGYQGRWINQQHTRLRREESKQKRNGEGERERGNVINHNRHRARSGGGILQSRVRWLLSREGPVEQECSVWVVN